MSYLARYLAFQSQTVWQKLEGFPTDAAESNFGHDTIVAGGYTVPVVKRLIGKPVFGTSPVVAASGFVEVHEGAPVDERRVGDFLEQLIHGLVSPIGVVRQTYIDDALQGYWHSEPERSQYLAVAAKGRFEFSLALSLATDSPSNQHFVKRRAERVDVSSEVHMPAQRLLGRRVSGRAGRRNPCGQSR